MSPHNYKDMRGKRVGKWTVLKKAGVSNTNTICWLCLCDCGTERVVRGEKLRQEKSMSCGCGNAQDMTGTVYGCWEPQELKRKFLEKSCMNDVWAVVRPKNIKNVDGDRIVVAWFHLHTDALEVLGSVNVPGAEVIETTVYLAVNIDDELDAAIFLSEEETDEYIERTQNRLEWRCICQECGAARYLTRAQLKKKEPPKCQCDPNYGNTYSAPLLGETVGIWEVVQRYGTNEHRLALWECRCTECGEIRILTSTSIKDGAPCSNSKCKKSAHQNRLNTKSQQ